MNRYRMRFAPNVWTPKLNPWVVRLLRPLRWRHQRRSQQLMEVNVQGADIVRESLRSGHGVMIMPNHSSHADPFTIYAAADKACTPIHIMATWHVFYDSSIITRWLLRTHGCYSVDREANDLAAFRRSVELLHSKPVPLVIFPEGEIYHCNDRVTPFREGAAAIAIAAARKADRKIVCIPCAISYRYMEDPTPQLLNIMGQLEEAILWQKQPQMPLPDRIYRFAEALLLLKEVEYLKAPQSGALTERISRLGDSILTNAERRHGCNAVGTVPERVKELRRNIIAKISSQDPVPTSDQLQQLENDLEDVFLVVQSFSYPGDYVLQKPSIERMAETLDKFEEDVLRKPTASLRGKRQAMVQFAEPIEVSADRKNKTQSTTLTQQVENAVQSMLDRM